MYGRILRLIRESKGRGQAEVARSVGISPAHLARLETNKRGLYLEDFVSIAEALGEKPGNLLPNDLGEIGHLKPLIDRLITVRPELIPRLTVILEEMILLTGQTGAPAAPAPAKAQKKPHPQITPGCAAKRQAVTSIGRTRAAGGAPELRVAPATGRPPRGTPASSRPWACGTRSLERWPT